LLNPQRLPVALPAANAMTVYGSPDAGILKCASKGGEKGSSSVGERAKGEKAIVDRLVFSRILGRVHKQLNIRPNHEK
jgi:hypothetical protein